jgi:hypothetical protein
MFLAIYRKQYFSSHSSTILLYACDETSILQQDVHCKNVFIGENSGWIVHNMHLTKLSLDSILVQYNSVEALKVPISIFAVCLSHSTISVSFFLFESPYHFV